jgi:hypothetical protein
MTAVPGVIDDGCVGSRAYKVIGSDSVDRFLERMSASLPLQERLRRCRHADAFLALAESSGVPLSRQDLVLLAMTAQHPCLPWAGRGKRFARSYALGSAQLEPGPADSTCPAA